MLDFNSRYYTNSKKPQKLLVFLHGYNNTLSEMRPVYRLFCQNIKGLVVAAPQGKSHSEKEPKRKSWYKISGFDSEGRRLKEETPVEEIAQIYNQAAPVLSETAMEINQYLNRVQQKYGLDDAHTFIAGFSQGAMLAIWTALIRRRELQGCFALSGLAAANTALNDYICSRPKVYLLHGQKDKQVLFKCMAYTQQWLEHENVPVQTMSFEHLGHEISSEEIFSIVKVINNQPLF